MRAMARCAKASAATVASGREAIGPIGSASAPAPCAASARITSRSVTIPTCVGTRRLLRRALATSSEEMRASIMRASAAASGSSAAAKIGAFITLRTRLR